MTDQFIGQTIAEKYRIDSVLREGNLGNVYHATHLLMDAPATVKILAPALAVDENITKRFSLEARTVSRIAHPHILNVKDFGSERNGATYIVYEEAEGETLREAINRGGALSFERAARIARQIAAALVAAHAGVVIHRRLNSNNIFLAQTASNAETVKVLDFGAADEIDSADGETRNLEYLAPEQNASIAEADERSDVYSLGVIFYETLAGEVPFTADNPTDLLMKQANNPPAPLSAFRGDLPHEIEPIILKALAKNPEMRYQTAQEFADDLDAVLRNSGIANTLVAPNAAALQANENIKNNLWKTAFVVLAGISLLAVALIYATSSKQTNPQTTLQTDTNGQPVQPLNPATGMNEQGASVLTPYTPEMLANSNLPLTGGGAMPQAMPNSDGFGDGYNPWARGVPPPGAPIYVPPGGQMIDPSNPNGSIFMPDGTVLVPVPANTSVNANVKPANTSVGKPTPAPANTATQPVPVPTANPQATPAKTPNQQPAPKPTAQPAKTPAATERRVQSGKEQDS